MRIPKNTIYSRFYPKTFSIPFFYNSLPPLIPCFLSHHSYLSPLSTTLSLVFTIVDDRKRPCRPSLALPPIPAAGDSFVQLETAQPASIQPHQPPSTLFLSLGQTLVPSNHWLFSHLGAQARLKLSCCQHYHTTVAVNLPEATVGELHFTLSFGMSHEIILNPYFLTCKV